MATDEQALLLQVSADVSKLEKAFQKAVAAVNTGSDTMEKRAEAMAARLNKAAGEAKFAPNFAEAFDKVFDRSRLAVIEEGSAKLNVFGAALEPLGPYGLAAAGAVAALGIAFEEARKAAEFADAIEDTAHKLHLTTDALQEYRYAVFAAGGTEQGADEALQGFSETLGKAQEGLVKGQRAFLALGFSKAQIQGFHDTDDALRQVIARIDELKSPAQQDAVIAQLGLEGMKPLILDGVDALDRLRAKAQEIGLVMDADLIKKGAEANKQYETLEQVISVQLKSAFVELAPVVADVLKITAQIATSIRDVADALTAIEDRSRSTLQRQIDQIDAQIAKDSPINHPGELGIGVDAHLQHLFDQRKQLQDRLDTLPEVTEEGGGSRSGGRRSLIPQGGSGSKYDITKASLDAIAQAMAAELQARKALTASAQEELTIEQQIINTAADKKIDDLKRQAADKKITAAAAQRAIALTNEQRDEQLALAQRQADWKLEDQSNQVRKALLDAQIAELQAQADITQDQQARAKIEEQILRLKHIQQWQAQGVDLSRQVQTGALTQDQADQVMQAGDDARRAETRARVFSDTYQPIHDALDAAVRGGWPGLAQYMADKLRERFVDALADVFTNMVLGTQNSSATNPFGSFLSSAFHFLGFADGTNYAPGGVALVGERGPELVNLPRGSQVIPAPQTHQLLSAGAGRGVSIALTVNVAAEGAVVADQVRAMVHQGVVQAIPIAIQGASVTVKSDLRRSAYNTIR